MSRNQPWRRRNKPLEYHQASDYEKLLWACGIPSRYWNVALSSLRPVGFTYESSNGIEHISASTQTEYLKERISNPELLQSNRFVCVASCPSDEHAMAAASLLACAAIKDGHENGDVVKVRMLDIQDYEASLADDIEFFSTTPEMLLIHNLNEDSSKERIGAARDLLRSQEEIYRIAVVASDNPLKFAREFLRLEPQEVYQFEGKPRKVISR